MQPGAPAEQHMQEDKAGFLMKPDDVVLSVRQWLSDHLPTKRQPSRSISVMIFSLVR